VLSFFFLKKICVIAWRKKKKREKGQPKTSTMAFRDGDVAHTMLCGSVYDDRDALMRLVHHWMSTRCASADTPLERQFYELLRRIFCLKRGLRVIGESLYLFDDFMFDAPWSLLPRTTLATLFSVLRSKASVFIGREYWSVYPCLQKPCLRDEALPFKRRMAIACTVHAVVMSVCSHIRDIRKRHMTLTAYAAQLHALTLDPRLPDIYKSERGRVATAFSVMNQHVWEHIVDARMRIAGKRT